MMGVIKSKKTWVVSAAALFIFTMAFDYYVHGRLLTDLYAQTPKLWRSDAEMKSLSMYCVLFHASIAVLIAMFYACWRENQTFGKVGSAKCPYRKSIMGFGLWIGLFMGVLAAAAYIWMPISAELARMWFLAAFVKGLLMGIVLNFVHTRYEAA